MCVTCLQDMLSLVAFISGAEFANADVQAKAELEALT
jgi:hypothetical protein